MSIPVPLVMALALGAAAPAVAAEKPSTTHATTTSAISASDDKAAEACQALPREAMLKDARCASLMKTRPALFTGQGRGETGKANATAAAEARKDANALSPAEGGKPTN